MLEVSQGREPVTRGGGPEDGRGLPQAGMGWSVLQAKDDISLETEAVLGGSQFQKQGGVAGAEAG